MIYVCKITDISQTTCILRSIHAHFLQLLRDGALRGRTCRRHGLTLNIFFPLLWFFLSPSLPRGAPRWFEASEKIRPHSIVLLRFPFCSSGNIWVLWPASVIYLSLYLSTMKTFQLWNPFMKHFLLLFFPLERVDVRGAPLVLTDCQATSLTTQSAPRAHRLTERDSIFMMLFDDRIVSL